MNRTIIKLILCVILVVHLENHLYAQQPPDSLFRKVVIFKKPAYGNVVDSAVSAYFTEARYPQATGFYIKPDSAGQLYIATAKHVVHRSDSIQSITIAWKSLQDKGELWSSHLFGDFRNVGLYDQDSLVDMVLIYNCLPPQAVKMFPKVRAFHPNEIMTKEEYISVKSKQELFYIGMNPDSLSFDKMYFWFRTGRLEKISTIRHIVHDTTRHITITYDFILNIAGKSGISGSPIIMKVGNSYKVFGIINGILPDSSQAKQSKNFIGTAGYRILEVLRRHSLL